MKQINQLILLALTAFTFACGGNDDPAPSVDAPLALNPTTIEQTSFEAKWMAVSTAESYQLDVSENLQFTSFVDGYQSKAVTGTSHEVTGLSSNTRYHYRLRAMKGTTVSKNSNLVSITTLLPENTPLKEAANGFYIGTAVQSGRLTGKHDELLRQEFSSITAEYEMKMDKMHPTADTYYWEACDAIVNYAQSNQINIHGHALIWHNSTPDWVENFAGTNDEFELMVKEYIHTVVTRYKGKIRSWDVVNEAILDGSGDYRNSVFYQRMGKDYIAKCFRWAREADPDVLLFYNDYNMASDQNKQDATFTMVDELMAANVPIDGLGFQMHIAYNGPSKETITKAANRIVERGLKAHFSELDIRANPNKDLTRLTEERALALKAKYKEVAGIYSALPAANKYALTIWGMKDDESWLLNFYGHIDWPLLYNADFTAKDAYQGFLEGLAN